MMCRIVCGIRWVRVNPYRGKVAVSWRLLIRRRALRGAHSRCSLPLANILTYMFPDGFDDLYSTPPVRVVKGGK